MDALLYICCIFLEYNLWGAASVLTIDMNWLEHLWLEHHIFLICPWFLLTY